MGNSSFAAAHLKVLIKQNHQITGVLTQLKNKIHKKSTSLSVKAIAQINGITCLQMCNFKDKEISIIEKIKKSDIIVVVSYGFIVPEFILDTTKFGGINVHASLLPHWRGSAPIQRLLQAGKNETGITIMQMDKNLDTGAILNKAICRVENQDNTLCLSNRLARLGCLQLVKTITNINNQEVLPRQQDNSKSTYAKKILKKEAHIQWSNSAASICNNVRAFNPWPVCYFKVKDQTFKVWDAIVINQYSKKKPGQVISFTQEGLKVATSDGVVHVKKLQKAGGRLLQAKELHNSQKDFFFTGLMLS